MVRFARENWPWIAAPIVLVAALVVLLYLLSDDSLAPPSYAIF